MTDSTNQNDPDLDMENRDLMLLMHDLLDRERHALMNGQLEQATRILHEKEALLAGFNALPIAITKELQAVHAKNSRNQVLLSCALDGIRVVNERIAELQRTHNSLETYDQSGRKTTITGLHTGHVERRA
jgi:flagellar biosynthesis/type III secretory pathway chaperone